MSWEKASVGVTQKEWQLTHGSALSWPRMICVGFHISTKGTIGVRYHVSPSGAREISVGSVFTLGHAWEHLGVAVIIHWYPSPVHGGSSRYDLKKQGIGHLDGFHVDRGEKYTQHARDWTLSLVHVASARCRFNAIFQSAGWFTGETEEAKSARGRSWKGQNMLPE